jgi:hypothetical protein
MLLDTSCPLAPALLRLLQTAACAEDLSDKTLARLSGFSTETVHTYFKRMFEATGIHSRGTLVIAAIQREWIQPPNTESQAPAE